MRALLPSLLSDAVGSPEHTISELNTQPADTPVQRFKCGLTTALTWLGARVVRYSFPVRLFHSLLHAGLSRRYPDTSVRATIFVQLILAGLLSRQANRNVASHVRKPSARTAPANF